MSRFKPGDIIKSVTLSSLQRVRVFEDYGIPLEYLGEDCYLQIGTKAPGYSLRSHWPENWIVDETFMVERLLEEYNQTTNEDI